MKRYLTYLLLFLLPTLLNAQTVDVLGYYNATAVTITLTYGQGSLLPSPPFVASWYNQAYGSVTADPLGEKINVIAVNGDTITVTRGYLSAAYTHDTPLAQYVIGTTNTTPIPTNTFTQTPTRTNTLVNTPTNTPIVPTATPTPVPSGPTTISVLKILTPPPLATALPVQTVWVENPVVFPTTQAVSVVNPGSAGGGGVYPTATFAVLVTNFPTPIPYPTVDQTDVIPVAIPGGVSITNGGSYPYGANTPAPVSVVNPGSGSFSTSPTPQLPVSMINVPTPNQTMVAGKDIQLTQVAIALTAIAPTATPTSSPILTPTATPNATQIQALQLTQIVQVYSMETQVALQITVSAGQGTPISPAQQATAIAALATQIAQATNTPTNTPILTPTATPNPTQIAAMVATLIIQQNALQTEIATIAIGNSTSSAQATQISQMYAVETQLAAQLTAIVTATPTATSQTSTPTPYIPHTDANNNQIFSANSVLGDLVTTERFNQVEVNFSGGFSNVNNQITSAVSGNGTTAVTNGEMILSTGTGAGEAAVSTVGSLEYRPGHEWYAYFTGAFPVSAVNSYARIGAYNGTDGFWIGYESGSGAATFGITRVQGGVTAFTAQSSWNADTCTGQTGSKFTLSSTPVALVQGYLNIYRIHGAWFGASPVQVDIFSPDGVWVNVETFKFPNTQLAPFMSTTTLNMKADVNKTSGAGSVTLASACWALGTCDSTQTLSDVNFDYNNGQITKSYIGGRLSNGQYQIAGLVQAGTPVPSGLNSLPVETGSPVSLATNYLGLSSFTEAPTAFSSGYTSLIGSSAGKTIYVYQWDMVSNGAATIYFSNSASAQLSESGVCLFGEQTAPTGGICFKGASGGDLGLNCSAACTISLHIEYLQQ